MASTPTAPFPHQLPGGPAPSPSPIGYPQGYGPQRASMPSPAPAPSHIQPMSGHPMPSPGGGYMPQTPHHHAPLYQPQPYVPSPAGPAGGHHPHMPAQPAIQPAAYDNRSMAPIHAALAPARAPMAAATPSPAAMQPLVPHAVGGGGVTPSHNVPGGYNPPQPPQVYTLPDTLDASIPDDVREQFQRDAQGRVLFFTTPPVYRPHTGLSEEHAGLGHSVRFLADRKAAEAERLRKRKERDEELARAEEARKKAAATDAASADASEKGETSSSQDRERAVLGVLSSFVESMDRMTADLNVAMDGWAVEKAKWQQERNEKAGRTNGLRH